MAAGCRFAASGRHRGMKQPAETTGATMQLHQWGRALGSVLLALLGTANSAGAADPAVLAAAQREGKVVWYTSVPIETAQKVANLFQQKFGITVELFRSGGSNILRRFQQESDGGKVFCDVLTHSEPAAARAMARRNLFLAYKPADFDKVPNEVKDPNGLFVAQRLNVLALYARDDKLPLGDRPRTWSDLGLPKYHGKLVMADPAFTSLQVTVVGMLSRMLGWEFYEKLRKNDIMLVQGNQQVSDMVKRGERVIAVGADSAYVGGSKNEGQAISTLYPDDGAFVVPSPSSVAKGSPNPNAAKVFADFMLSRDVQQLFPLEHLYSARTDIAGPDGSPPLGEIKIIPVDYDYIEAEATRIKKRFSEILQ